MSIIYLVVSEASITSLGIPGAALAVADAALQDILAAYSVHEVSITLLGASTVSIMCPGIPGATWAAAAAALHGVLVEQDWRCSLLGLIVQVSDSATPGLDANLWVCEQPAADYLEHVFACTATAPGFWYSSLQTL